MPSPLRSIVIALGVAAGTVLSAAPAQAQLTQRPERPYRGLFGGGATPGDGHSVNLSASVGGGYDDNIRMDQRGILGSGGASNITQPVAGTLASGSVSIGYAANLGRVGFSANVGSSTRYYPSQDSAFLSAHGGGLSLRAPLGQRSSFAVSQSVSYIPFTFSTVLPFVEDPALGAFDTPPIDLVTSRREFLTYTTSSSLGHQFSRRVSGNLSYSYGGRDSSIYDNPFSRHAGGGGLSFAVSQGLSLNLGYQRMEGRYGAGRTVSQDSVNAGINYRRSLSFSRRTSLGFGTGSTAVTSGDRTRFRMVGTATLSHEVGRTWLASANYTRGVRFIESLLEPVFQDSVMAGFGGLVNRRVQVQSSAQASFGQVGLGRSNGFNTYVAAAGATVAISRHVTFGVNYALFHYRFRGDTVLPPGVPSEVNRQSIRANISVWAPLLNTARRANATR